MIIIIPDETKITYLSDSYADKEADAEYMEISVCDTFVITDEELEEIIDYFGGNYTSEWDKHTPFVPYFKALIALKELGR